MAVRAKSYIPKPAPAKIETEALKTAGGSWQKCHTRSFSDSRLLRKARVPRYLPSSRSARIVVTPLHESPGPTTAGASLFWHQLPRGLGQSPTAREFCDLPLTSQKKRKMLPLSAAAKCMAVRAENRPRCRLRRRACAVSPPGRVVGDVASDVFGAEGKSQRRRQTQLEMTSARSG